VEIREVGESPQRPSASASFKSTDVTKAVEPNVDLGNLLLEDFDPLDAEQYKSSGDTYLKNVARNNAQFLVNKLWELPTKRVEDVIVAVLPKPTTILPREKEIPKIRPTTKWQEYAKMKGIQKRKKGRMVWDEQSQSWKPAWGYQRANNAEDDWLIEIPDQKDPYRDYYGDRKEAKKERVAKNELQRLRNVGRASGGSEVEGIGLNVEKKSSKDVSRQLDRAKHATASLGKYAEKIPKEKTARNAGKKRKFLPNENAIPKEKDKALEIWQRMEAKKPKLDIEKAVSSKVRARGKRNTTEDDDDDEKPQKRKRGSGSGGSGKGKPRKGVKGSKRKGKMHSLNKKKHSSKNKRT